MSQTASLQFSWESHTASFPFCSNYQNTSLWDILPLSIIAPLSTIVSSWYYTRSLLFHSQLSAQRSLYMQPPAVVFSFTSKAIPRLTLPQLLNQSPQAKVPYSPFFLSQWAHFILFYWISQQWSTLLGTCSFLNYVFSCVHWHNFSCISSSSFFKVSFGNNSSYPSFISWNSFRLRPRPYCQHICVS